MLYFALVFLSQLLCVDIKWLEGVNGQQHVSNVSLGEKKKMTQAFTEYVHRNKSFSFGNKPV